MGKEAVRQKMPCEQRPGWSEARFSSSLVFSDCGAWAPHPGPGHPVADDRETLGGQGNGLQHPSPCPTTGAQLPSGPDLGFQVRSDSKKIPWL